MVTGKLSRRGITATIRPVAAVKRDYYEILGVARDADEDAIRRSFYALAREWHPDVAEEDDAYKRFRELAEAYSVLSKPEARHLYDRYGYRGRGNAGFDEALAEEVAAAPPERGDNVYQDIQLRAFEAAEGTRCVVRYRALALCPTCGGYGVLTLPDPSCEFCGGSGYKRMTSDLDAVRLLQVEFCPHCAGDPCSTCRGTGTVPTQKRIRLLVPPGVEDGTYLRSREDGNDGGPDSIPGDLLVRVEVLPAPKDPGIVRYAAFVLLLAAITTLSLYVFVR
jgi:molecular chaperone DnaJ